MEAITSSRLEAIATIMPLVEASRLCFWALRVEGSKGSGCSSLPGPWPMEAIIR